MVVTTGGMWLVRALAIRLRLQWGLGNLPLNLGVALNANDHAFLEQAFGAPIDALMVRWGSIQEVFLPHIVEARSLLRNL